MPRKRLKCFSKKFVRHLKMANR
ncbi:UNVERIFIED_CONTAM: hypothetical protein GTU68_013769 [Idotea baltica]|nr:hypothetical protein [Idotea baltica]